MRHEDIRTESVYRPIMFRERQVEAINLGKMTQATYLIEPRHNRVEDNVRLPWVEGQRLWLRETHALIRGQKTKPPITTNRPIKIGYDWWILPVYIRADGMSMAYERVNWQFPEFMPEWAARIRLNVTFVETGPLNLLTMDDALKEGFDGERVYIGHGDWIDLDPIDEFREDWDRRNPDAPWSSNPMVATMGFTVENIHKIVEG